jgi:hypothetical protein
MGGHALGHAPPAESLLAGKGTKEKQMYDVPLADANILWTPRDAETDNPGLRGKMIVEHRKLGADASLYLKHRAKLGACIMWSSWTGDQRLLELFRYVQMMTVRDGLLPSVVHTGLAVIPEYRAVMSQSFVALQKASEIKAR